MRLLLIPTAAASLVGAGCAPMDGAAVPSVAASSARQCFDVRQVSNYRQGGTGEVYLRVGRSAVYAVEAAGGCTDLDFAQRVALVPDGRNGSRLCTDDWARVIVPGSTGADTVCRVRISRQLTAEQVAALPPRHRP
jgi:hypothetical protein